MEIFTYILTAILAITLIVAGIWLCIRRGHEPVRPATITIVLSIGFLMLLLLHMSKFKHVRGFGFDAETWDEKQVEAAQLVDQLSSISEGLSQQVALLASRIGFWGSGLSNPELADLLRHTAAQLQITKTISDSRQAEILEPIRLRISTNYWNAARNLIDKTYLDKSKEVQQDRQHNKIDDTNEQAMLQQISAEAAKLDAIPTPKQISFDLQNLIDAFTESKALSPIPRTVLSQLIDLNDDLRFFNANKDNKLRRDIDLDLVYPSPHQLLMGD